MVVSLVIAMLNRTRVDDVNLKAASNGSADHACTASPMKRGGDAFPCASAADRLRSLRHSSTLLPATSQAAARPERLASVPGLDSKQPKSSASKPKCSVSSRMAGSLSSARLLESGRRLSAFGRTWFLSGTTNATAGRQPQRSRTITEILSSRPELKSI